ncbi:hypothetical protein SDC9_162973 [bioreactor metagenome]|uniref:Uncharacterized protein n=1 Tax=bioreactor metagenome TaxID=1076179 RepID=A0A645FQI1_9ZZZZ
MIGVGIAGIGRRLAEQQQVLRHAAPHLGTVFALLRPTESIGLIVLAHDIGHDGLHTHIAEAVLCVVLDARGVERIDSLEAEACQAAWDDPVLDVNGSDAARLEDAQQVRRQEVHLFEEMRVVVGMAEVRVVRRVLVLS